MLQQELPEARFLPLRGYRIFYHNTMQNFAPTIIKQLPKIAGAIRDEHRWLKQLLQEQYFDAVISDNRYGLWNRNTISVIITHQINILSGLGAAMDAALRRISHRFIRRFSECWIPDIEGDHNIAGMLSHGSRLPGNASYIGLLSRMKNLPAASLYDVAIILSGPEPRRTIWEKALLNMLRSFAGRALLVRGLPAATEQLPRLDGVTIVNHLPAAELNIAMQSAEWVICRSGYSSVMDLLRLKHKAILVPTPGQTEQEYLADHLHNMGIFFAVKEEIFSLEKHLQEATFFPCDFNGLHEDDHLLQEQIERLLHAIRKKSQVDIPL
jgi:UDP-N-acetylglucosamine transferase subunit ALG13